MRIVSFGCSMTYGHGLPDCIDSDLKSFGDKPSTMAWPSLVANRANADVLNLATPGASNDDICLRILNFNDYKEDDHVIILWSYMYRALVFLNDGSYAPISPHRMIFSLSEGGEHWEAFYKAHTDYDLWVRTFKNIHHATCFLQSKKLKFSNFYFDHWSLKYKKVSNSFLNNINVPLSYLNFMDKTIVVDSALDKMHPGIESQKNIADRIYNTHFNGESNDTKN